MAIFEHPMAGLQRMVALVVSIFNQNSRGRFSYNASPEPFGDKKS